jgi:hypothetical protein
MSSPPGNPRQGICSLGSGLCRAGELARTVGRRSMQKRAAAAVTRLGYASWRRPFQFRPGNSAGPGTGQLSAAAGLMIVFLLLYADFTVAGRCRIGFTVLEVVKYLDGVPCRAPLEVEVVLEIYLVAVLVTQKRDDGNLRAAACRVLAPGVTDLDRVVNDPVAALDGLLDDAEGLGPAIQGLRVELLPDGVQEGARCQRAAGGGIKDAQNLSEDRLRLGRLDDGDAVEPVHLRRIANARKARPLPG